jgi:anthranilate phosphoribosyltransferase
MNDIMAGRVPEDQIRGYLLALNAKGPTVEEITGAARIMRQYAVPVKTKHPVILDTCGTGGDQRGTFNVSTLTALVVASCGVAVAKHGNRSVSSRCGSADILEALGVNLEIGQERLGACLDEVGIAFLFAQRHHPAMKNVAGARKALAVKTIFNILGPLTNPAGATHQMMGVYSRELVEPLAQVLKNLGARRALVVHGNDGLDEITTTDKTFVSEFDGADVLSYDIDPEEFGVNRARLSDLLGGDLKDNTAIALGILDGKKGPARDIVMVNSAYALYTAQAVKTIGDGIERSKKALDTGAARQKLEQLKEFTCRGR